jgi:O-antigen ligase
VLAGDGINNSYLSIAAETGLIGLLLYLAFLVLVCAEMVRIYRATRNLNDGARALGGAACSTFIVLSAHNLLMDVNWSFWYWISIAMVFVVARVLRRTSGHDALALAPAARSA